MTLSDYNLLVEYMNENPPVHLSVAAFMGKKPKPQLTWETESFESLAARWTNLGGGLS